MAWSTSDYFPEWGDAGERPGDGFQYDGGDQVNEKHLDYFLNALDEFEEDVWAALEDIDTDGDGIVDEADTANLYKGNDIDTDGDGIVDEADTANLYKGNDIDTDGDGVVNEAEDTTTVKGNDIDTDGDGKVDAAESADNATNADQYDNTSPSDGTGGQFLQTDGTTTQWANVGGNSVQTISNASGEVVLDFLEYDMFEISCVGPVNLTATNASDNPQGLIYLEDGDGSGPYPISWLDTTHWSSDGADVAGQVPQNSNVNVFISTSDGGNIWRAESFGTDWSGATESFDYTGSVQTFNVEAYDTISAEMFGSGGEGTSQSNGGIGGYVEADIDVSSFSEVSVYVGGGDGNRWGRSNGGAAGDSGAGHGAGSTKIVAGDGTFLAAADGGGGGAEGGGGGGGARGGEGGLGYESGRHGTDGQGTGFGGYGGDDDDSGGEHGQDGGPGGTEVNSTYVTSNTETEGGGNSGNAEVIIGYN